MGRGIVDERSFQYHRRLGTGFRRGCAGTIKPFGPLFPCRQGKPPRKHGLSYRRRVRGQGRPAEVPIEELLAKADPARGARFSKCASCHTITPGGANGIGPNIHAIFGDEIGKGRGGFAFSAGLAGKGGKWDFSNMNEWLKNPRAFADGTKMTFAGLESAEDRAAVMVYLNQQGSNLPCPLRPPQQRQPVMHRIRRRFGSRKR
jgi:cytochrome c